MAELEALAAATLVLPDDEVEKLDANTRFLVRSHPQLPKLRAMEIAAVFSGNHNDPESWWNWADKDKQEEASPRIRFWRGVLLLGAPLPSLGSGETG